MGFAIHHFKLVARIRSIPKSLYYAVLIPGMINLFFLCNYTFSSKPKIETYEFSNQQAYYSRNRGRGGMENTSLIYLEGNHYDEILWNRVFFDVEQTKYKSVIQYRFEEGLFGIRVLKDYEFKHS